MHRTAWSIIRWWSGERIGAGGWFFWKIVKGASFGIRSLQPRGATLRNTGVCSSPVRRRTATAWCVSRQGSLRRGLELLAGVKLSADCDNPELAPGFRKKLPLAGATIQEGRRRCSQKDFPRWHLSTCL